MKLESLNNEKFKLNTEEMGSLVGGKITTTPSSGGQGWPTGTTADITWEYRGADIQNGVESVERWFSGKDDVAARDATTPPHQK
jgi:hypothetical protein